MSMKRVVFAGVAALFVSACGGAPADEASVGGELESQEQGIIYPCDGTMSWTRWWYSDYTKTVEVGRDTCECDGSWTASGVHGRYYDYNNTVDAC
ncbi:hypothetical protein JYJ95_02625 [Corallococcus exiguus]|uniref:hypothetical protein n=1 Tax=Corallococcus exiguus TaxID=83462 RepID=UPI001A8EF7EB|nr:hypothetical protein [Corallococcus exiguus]MBN8465389.1 hypothetical protein [Corallococcus exiguus]